MPSQLALGPQLRDQGSAMPSLLLGVRVIGPPAPAGVRGHPATRTLAGGPNPAQKHGAHVGSLRWAWVPAERGGGR